MKQLKVYNIKGKKIDSVKLDEEIFGKKVNKKVLHQVVNMYLSNKRIGAASTKTRAEVRGGGRKPWRQKGTGRARAGSIRSPLFRGGGVIFGPKPKDYSYRVPQKIIRKALASAILSKAQEDNCIVVNEIKIDRPNTKEFSRILEALKLDNDKVLVVVDDYNKNIKLSSRNMEKVMTRSAKQFNAYEILTHDKLIMTKKSLEVASKRVAL
jgi:large subunit ribosomal protein L4